MQGMEGKGMNYTEDCVIRYPEVGKSHFGNGLTIIDSMQGKVEKIEKGDTFFDVIWGHFFCP